MRQSPTVVFFDGLRWHARAFSHVHGEFRDFVLARIQDPALLGPSPGQLPDDADWHLRLTALVGPHPGLSDMQRAVIERDYGMQDGHLACTVRAALLPYFLHSMRIGPDDLARDANAQQVVLLNRRDLKAWIRF